MFTTEGHPLPVREEFQSARSLLQGFDLAQRIFKQPPHRQVLSSK